MLRTRFAWNCFQSILGTDFSPVFEMKTAFTRFTLIFSWGNTEFFFVEVST
ncbi:hypothetical protein [Guptibacillus hwajinpoensis]|uniref:hypothetical protein n=1 Tax=Guptibacillus hwajinpoensis TaxID=208199 RepID=UPI0037359350